eukprot:ANDGO_07088.mRNA.1 hypothetical protein
MPSALRNSLVFLRNTLGNSDETSLDLAHAVSSVEEQISSSVEDEAADLAAEVLSKDHGLLYLLENASADAVQDKIPSKLLDSLFKSCAIFAEKFAYMIGQAFFVALSDSVYRIWMKDSVPSACRVHLAKCLQHIFRCKKTCARIGYAPMHVSAWIQSLSVFRNSKCTATLKGQLLECFAAILRAFHAELQANDASGLSKMRDSMLFELRSQDSRTEQQGPVIAGLFHAISVYCQYYTDVVSADLAFFLGCIRGVLLRFMSERVASRYEVPKAALDAVHELSSRYADLLFGDDPSKLYEAVEFAVFSTNADVRKCALRAFESVVEGFCSFLMSSRSPRLVEICEYFLLIAVNHRLAAISSRDDVKKGIHFIRIVGIVFPLCMFAENQLRIQNLRLSTSVDELIALVEHFFDMLYGNCPSIPISESFLHLPAFAQCFSCMMLSLSNVPQTVDNCVRRLLSMILRIVPSQEMYQNLFHVFCAAVGRIMFACATHAFLLHDVCSFFSSLVVQYSCMSRNQLESSLSDWNLHYESRLSGREAQPSLLDEQLSKVFSRFCCRITDEESFSTSKWSSFWMSFCVGDRPRISVVEESRLVDILALRTEIMTIFVDSFVRCLAVDGNRGQRGPVPATSAHGRSSSLSPEMVATCKFLGGIFELGSISALQKSMFPVLSAVVDLLHSGSSFACLFDLLAGILRFISVNLRDDSLQSLATPLRTVLSFLYSVFRRLSSDDFSSAVSCFCFLPVQLIDVRLFVSVLETILSLKSVSSVALISRVLLLVEETAFCRQEEILPFASSIISWIDPLTVAQSESTSTPVSRDPTSDAAGLRKQALRLVTILSFLTGHSSQLVRDSGFKSFPLDTFSVPISTSLGNVEMMSRPLFIRCMHLAEHSPVRSVRIASVEYVYSFILYLIGVHAEHAKVSSEAMDWFEVLFPFILRLTVQEDAVIVQLMQSLTMQLVHYFVDSRDRESFATVFCASLVAVASFGDGRLRLSVLQSLLTEFFVNLTAKEDSLSVFDRCIRFLLFDNDVEKRECGLLLLLPWSNTDIPASFQFVLLQLSVSSALLISNVVSSPVYHSVVELYSSICQRCFFTLQKDTAFSERFDDVIKLLRVNLCHESPDVRRFVWFLFREFATVSVSHAASSFIHSAPTVLVQYLELPCFRKFDASDQISQTCCIFDSYTRFLDFCSRYPSPLDSDTLLRQVLTHHDSKLFFLCETFPSMFPVAESSERVIAAIVSVLRLLPTILPSCPQLARNAIWLQLCLVPSSLGISIERSPNRLRYIHVCSKFVQAARGILDYRCLSTRGVLFVPSLLSAVSSPHDKRLLLHCLRVLRAAFVLPVAEISMQIGRPFSEFLLGFVVQSFDEPRESSSSTDGVLRDVLRLAIDCEVPSALLFQSFTRSVAFFSFSKEIIAFYVAPLCSSLLSSLDSDSVMSQLRQLFSCLVDLPRDVAVQSSVASTIHSFMHALGPVLRKLSELVSSRIHDAIEVVPQVLELLSMLFECSSVEYQQNISADGCIRDALRNFVCVLFSLPGSSESRALQISIVSNLRLFFTSFPTHEILTLLKERVFFEFLHVPGSFAELSELQVDDHLKIVAAIIRTACISSCDSLLSDVFPIISESSHPGHQPMVKIFKEGLLFSSTPAFLETVLTIIWKYCTDRKPGMSALLIQRRLCLFMDILIPVVDAMSLSVLQDFALSLVVGVMHVIADVSWEESKLARCEKSLILSKQFAFLFLEHVALRLGNDAFRGPLNNVFSQARSVSNPSGKELMSAVVQISTDPSGESVCPARFRLSVDRNILEGLFRAAFSCVISVLVITQTANTLSSKVALLPLHKEWLRNMVSADVISFNTLSSGTFWKSHARSAAGFLGGTGVSSFSISSTLSHFTPSVAPNSATANAFSLTESTSSSHLRGNAAVDIGDKDLLPDVASVCKVIDVIAEYSKTSASAPSLLLKLFFELFSSSLESHVIADKNICLMLVKVIISRPQFFGSRCGDFLLLIADAVFVESKFGRQESALTLLERQSLACFCSWKEQLVSTQYPGLHSSHGNRCVNAACVAFLLHRETRGRPLFKADMELFSDFVELFHSSITWINSDMIQKLVARDHSQSDALYLVLSGLEITAILLRNNVSPFSCNPPEFSLPNGLQFVRPDATQFLSVFPSMLSSADKRVVESSAMVCGLFLMKFSLLGLGLYDSTFFLAFRDLTISALHRLLQDNETRGVSALRLVAESYGDILLNDRFDPSALSFSTSLCPMIADLYMYCPVRLSRLDRVVLLFFKDGFLRNPASQSKILSLLHLQFVRASPEDRSRVRMDQIEVFYGWILNDAWSFRGAEEETRVAFASNFCDLIQSMHLAEADFAELVFPFVSLSISDPSLSVRAVVRKLVVSMFSFHPSLIFSSPLFSASFSAENFVSWVASLGIHLFETLLSSSDMDQPIFGSPVPHAAGAKNPKELEIRDTLLFSNVCISPPERVCFEMSNFIIH